MKLSVIRDTRAENQIDLADVAGANACGFGLVEIQRHQRAA
jgi:hypothetical protein